jgi:rhodanese-related sulfurtransferase
VVVALQELAREISAEVVKAEDTLVAPELRAPEPLEHILEDVAQQRAALIDVRTSKEQSATPVNLALQIPVESETDLEKVLQATPKDKPVYVFCRGAYCITASRTAEFLRSQGRQAWCLRETALEIERPRESATENKQKQNRSSIAEKDE